MNIERTLTGLGLKLAIHNATRVCKEHGEYPTPLLVDAEGRERGGGCPKCRAITQRAEWSAILSGRCPNVPPKAQGVPKRFEHAEFSTFQVRNDGQKRVLSQAFEFVDRFADRVRDGGCITLLGTTGTGKTRLSCSIANALAPAGYKVRYVKMYDMIDHIRESWGSMATRTTRDVIGEYIAQDLLIIDELAVSNATSDNEKILLFRVIDGRYEECRPSVLVSNQTLESFGGAVGDRVLDRLIERGQLAFFEWESGRATSHEEAPQTQLSLVAAK